MFRYLSWYYFQSLLSQLSLFRWSRPSQINGILESYSIFMSHDGAEPVLTYNTSELLEDHTLRNLTPGTSYTITVAVSHLTTFFPFFYLLLWSSLCFLLYLCSAGLHTRWVHIKSPKPGSDWGEHSRECSCTTGHAFVPTCTQRQLDSSWHTKWWEHTHLVTPAKFFLHCAFRYTKVIWYQWHM